MIATPIFLDGFSTLPLAPEVRAKMLMAWEQPGNAGSSNAAGEHAAGIVADGRVAVADLIGATTAEIIFTSGATEANNLALLGVTAAAVAQMSGRRRVIVSSVEHKAVLEPARALIRAGFEVLTAPVDPYGRLDVGAYAALVDERLLLASVMMVNNETGVMQPVAEAAAIARTAGALFHTDAAQAAGKIKIDVGVLDVDYLSLSAHKCYGPMGIGALYVAAGAPIPLPLLYGGGQQAAVRPGTEPVPLIAGFGAAALLADAQLGTDHDHGTKLINLLLERLAERQLQFRRITGNHPVVPGSAAIAIDGIDGEALCMQIARDVSISTGSACNAGQLTTSHVLEAIGFSTEEARTVIRIFCSRYNDEEEIETAAAHIADGARRSRLATGELRQ